MTEKQRLKHERDNHRVVPSATLIGTDRDAFNMKDFVEPKTPPRLSWLNAKTHAGFSDRRHSPGRKEEQADALYDNGFKETKRLIEEHNDERENQAIDRAENEGMGAGTQQSE